MKNTKKILRQAVFTALDGNVEYESVVIPVVDEKLIGTTEAGLFIVLSTQSESPIERNDSSFNTESIIDILIIEKTGAEVSKDATDDVCETVLEILCPTATTHGLTVPSGFQFLNVYPVNTVIQSMSLTETQSVLQQTIRLSVQIIQQ
jgi:hypothetical protein